MRKSLVSIVALGLFAGAPVMAESTNNEAKNQSTQQQSTQQQSTQQGTQQQGTQQTGTQQQGTQQQGTQQTGALSDQQFQEMLSGYEERSDLEGRIARAMTADGNDVFVLVGPRDLNPDDSFETQDSDVRDRFEGAGFTGVQNLGNARMARANLDEDHYIFAFSADQISRQGMQTGGLSGETGTDAGPSDTQAGQMDQSESTQSELAQSDLQQSDRETTTEMGQTEMDMAPETGTTDQAGTGIGESTQLGQMDTETEQGQSGAMGESTQLGQMDTETEQGQSGAGIGQDDSQVGQMNTDAETGQDDTQVGEMETDAETGQIGRGLSEADAGRMASDIEGAGIQNADQFQGQVVRATSNGSPVFFLITSRDMSSEIDISEDEVRQKLQQADLQDIEFVDDVTMVRGDFEDDSVFVLAGDLMGRGTQQ